MFSLPFRFQFGFVIIFRSVPFVFRPHSVPALVLFRSRFVPFRSVPLCSDLVSLCSDSPFAPRFVPDSFSFPFRSRFVSSQCVLRSWIGMFQMSTGTVSVVVG